MRTTTAPAATAAVTTSVGLAAAALVLGLAGPASAERYGVDDPRDTHHGCDVLALDVRNATSNLVVTTYHEDLRRDPATGSGGAFYIDTDREDRGPEYVLAAGFYEGTDYVLRRTEGFGTKRWGDAVEHGDYVLRIDYRQDRVRARISRAALGSPGAVRVGIRVAGTRSDGSSHGLVDWVGPRRSMTPWIDRG